jgi:hypothetical protein
MLKKIMDCENILLTTLRDRFFVLWVQATAKCDCLCNHTTSFKCQNSDIDFGNFATYGERVLYWVPTMGARSSPTL